jgi:hypothetical protein
MALILPPQRLGSSSKPTTARIAAIAKSSSFTAFAMLFVARSIERVVRSILRFDGPAEGIR